MRTFCSLLRSVFRLWKHILISVYRYSAVLAAGAVLLGGLSIILAELDKGGRTTLTVYAETSSIMPAEGTADEISKAEETAYGTESENLEEGQKLAGETVVKNVFLLREARAQRQENIEQAKNAADRKENEKEEKSTSSDVVTAGSAINKKIKNTEDTTGQAGPGEKPSGETIQAKEAWNRGQTGEEIRCSQGDYETLKRIVEAEAGICDIKGRILVANVIINRVRNQEFPDTITEVVYQKSQFSPVSNGSLNTCTVTPETIEAVDRALAGEDYSQGALYFMNRGRSKSSNVSWFDHSLTYLFQHDRHEFFK